MVPRASSYRDGFDVPQDMIEGFYENEYPTNDNVGKYLVREKQFPYNDDLVYDDDMIIPLLRMKQLTSTDVLNKILMKKRKAWKLCLTKPIQYMPMIIH